MREQITSKNHKRLRNVIEREIPTGLWMSRMLLCLLNEEDLKQTLKFT